MAHSYSAIKEFKTCQRKYYETRVLKLHPPQETEATIYGKEVHKALEDFIKNGTPLGAHSRFQKYVDLLAKVSGDKYTEHEMALDDGLNPVAFDDETALVRGIADLVIINGDKAIVVDYKTGKDKYPDKDQLELMAIMIFRQYPEVQTVHGALLFLLYDNIVEADYTRSQAPQLWVNWASRILDIERAIDLNVFQENPSGLCRGWCPCKSCPHWRERK